jgi:carbon monoxide dehydrogenase subunit G
VEQTGEYRIAASRDAVWAALNDPTVLARCIDGCQSMEKTAPDQFDATVKAQVGPVRATFDAQLKLEDVVPPQSYTIAASVKGGAAGFARGTAQVALTDEGEQTLLRYAVNASVGGKLAQVGSRLIDGAARKMAEDFFSALRHELGGADTQADDSGALPTGAPPSPGVDAAEARAYESGGRWLIWPAAFVALVMALLFSI